MAIIKIGLPKPAWITDVASVHVQEGFTINYEPKQNDDEPELYSVLQGSYIRSTMEGSTFGSIEYHQGTRYENEDGTLDFCFNVVTYRLSTEPEIERLLFGPSQEMYLLTDAGKTIDRIEADDYPLRELDMEVEEDKEDLVEAVIEQTDLSDLAPILMRLSKEELTKIRLESLEEGFGVAHLVNS